MIKLRRLPHKLANLSRIATLLLCALLCIHAPSVLADGPASNITDDEANSINAKTPYFSLEQWQCANNGGTVTTTGSVNVTGGSAATSGSWNSGDQPPYILEEFAIETLKDLAAKNNVPAANVATQVVTQEHVIALIAFMFGEGGDINNHDLFNPLNTGINAPDLINGAHSVSGVQSFKSFDAGVEATARTMMLPTQNRLAATLINQNTNAQQFMEALTYYQRYSGNAEWAAASMPPNQDSYYQQRLVLVSQVRSRYADIAGLQMGTPAKEQLENLTDKSKLQFHPTGDTSAPGDASNSIVASQTGTCSSANSLASGTPASCSSATGQVSTGNLALLCEAEKFDPFGYLWGGGHQDPEKFMSNFNATGGFTQPFKQVVDCSGLETVAIWNAYHQKVIFTTENMTSFPQYLRRIDPSQAQPGDLMRHPGHTEIAMDAGGKETFGAHTDHALPKDQISVAHGQTWTDTYTYIGPGAGTSTKSL